MSELDDVQTTVGVIGGLRARIAELEAKVELLTKERDFIAHIVFMADDSEMKLAWMVKTFDVYATGLGFPYGAPTLADLERRWAERGGE